jgi:hypothetical protein
MRYTLSRDCTYRKRAGVRSVSTFGGVFVLVTALMARWEEVERINLEERRDKRER